MMVELGIDPRLIERILWQPNNSPSVTWIRLIRPGIVKPGPGAAPAQLSKTAFCIS